MSDVEGAQAFQRERRLAERGQAGGLCRRAPQAGSAGWLCRLAMQARKRALQALQAGSAGWLCRLALQAGSAGSAGSAGGLRRLARRRTQEPDAKPSACSSSCTAVESCVAHSAAELSSSPGQKFAYPTTANGAAAQTADDRIRRMGEGAHPSKGFGLPRRGYYSGGPCHASRHPCRRVGRKRRRPECRPSRRSQPPRTRRE